MVATADASCGSTCSVSPLPCLGSELCPPAGDDSEQCIAGVENRPFEIRHLGFPGPYCELLLGGPLTAPADIAMCVAVLVEQTATVAVEGVLGAVPQGAGLSKDGVACLGAATDGAGKLVRILLRAAAKCRDAVNKGKKALNPTTCVDDDARLAAELDPCGAGVGSTTSVAVAVECLVDLAREVADGRVAPADRLLAPVSPIEGAYPPAPRCGDNLVNQLANPFLLLGEECDGSDDSACPDNCLWPEDLFECRRADIPRLRFFAQSAGSETDAGWTGLSHDQLAADLSGFIVDLEGVGHYIEDMRSCFVDPIVAQGGSTLNAQGSPTNISTVGLFCQKRSVNIGANSGAGFGGPTRVRVRWTNVPNFTSIP